MRFLWSVKRFVDLTLPGSGTHNFFELDRSYCWRRWGTVRLPPFRRAEMHVFLWGNSGQTGPMFIGPTPTSHTRPTESSFSPRRGNSGPIVNAAPRSIEEPPRTSERLCRPSRTARTPCLRNHAIITQRSTTSDQHRARFAERYPAHAHLSACRSRPRRRCFA